MKTVGVNKIVRRSPLLEDASGLPDWCHHHCGKMKVDRLDVDAKERRFVIKASAVKVTIFRANDCEWFVNWEITHDLNMKSFGRTLLTNLDLARAFCIDEGSHESGKGLLERYGGESAKQGCYIRWKNFLNIPCPGTGDDGDPNVSIEISEEIREAVKQLLEVKEGK